MHKLFLLFVLAVGLISHSHAEEKRQEMSRYTMAYSGGESYQGEATFLVAFQSA